MVKLRMLQLCLHMVNRAKLLRKVVNTKQNAKKNVDYKEKHQ